jgi:hypothetical protein
MSSPRPVVLIGFAEADSAPEVAWSLLDAGCDVRLFGRRGRPYALRHSRFVVSHDISAPESDLNSAITDLKRVMSRMASKNGHKAVLLPLDDTAVWLCDRVQKNDDWVLAGPSGKGATLALDKWEQVQLALESGFNVPISDLVRSGDEILAFADRCGYPIILKPAECVTTSAGRRLVSRNWICAGEQEMRRAIAEWDQRVPLLAQRFIAGTGEGVFGIATIDGVRVWSAHRRLRMMNPHGSGSSACVSTAVPADLRNQVSAFVEKARWRGLFMIEILRDQHGKPWFVELNGRTWGSMALARRQGLEYPAWQVHLALDEHSPAGLGSGPVPGVVCRNVGRELMHLAFVWRGKRSAAQVAWPTFLSSLREVVSFRRSHRVYNWRRSDWKVFMTDVYYTLRKNLVKSRS